jgi:hypothetical protein
MAWMFFYPKREERAARKGLGARAGHAMRSEPPRESRTNVSFSRSTSPWSPWLRLSGSIRYMSKVILMFGLLTLLAGCVTSVVPTAQSSSGLTSTHSAKIARNQADRRRPSQLIVGASY